MIQEEMKYLGKTNPESIAALAVIIHLITWMYLFGYKLFLWKNLVPLQFKILKGRKKKEQFLDRNNLAMEVNGI